MRGVNLKILDRVSGVTLVTITVHGVSLRIPDPTEGMTPVLTVSTLEESTDF